MGSTILRRFLGFCYHAARNFEGLHGMLRRALYRLPLVVNLYDRYVLQPSLPSEDVILSWDGQRIVVDNPKQNLIARDIFLKGVWEPEVTKYICPRITAGMTAIDIGADIGYYALLFARRVGKPGRVIAFEPIPSARKMLERNIELNNYGNVTVCDFALFSTNGSVILEAPRELSRINPGKIGHEINGIEIQTRVFDECIPELDIQKIDLVKIDVEGAELDVLCGMRRSLEKYHPALLVEVHPDHLGYFKYHVEDLLTFLESLKYSVRPVDKPSLDFNNGNVTIYCV